MARATYAIGEQFWPTLITMNNRDENATMCHYCGKPWPRSRMYAVRDKPMGNVIGYQCQDYEACRYRQATYRPSA